MSEHYHVIVWIDHLEAKIFHFDPTDFDRTVIHPENPTRHIHHKANSQGSGHAATDPEFLQHVAKALTGAGAVLITGPANTKTLLMEHITKHDPAVAARIAGVETVDHPTDGELVALARRFFKAVDGMHPQT